jgi:hypothetical protein
MASSSVRSSAGALAVVTTVSEFADRALSAR